MPFMPPFLPALLLVATNVSIADTIRVRNGDADGLHHALLIANQQPQIITRIVLPPNGFYGLKRPLPMVEGSVVIVGRKAELRAQSPQIEWLLGTTQEGQLVVHDLIIAGGGGGAIRNAGTMSLEGSQLVDHLTQETQAIVLNQGQLSIHHSEFAHNVVHSPQVLGYLVDNQGTLTISNTRFNDNYTAGRGIWRMDSEVVRNDGFLHMQEVVVSGHQDDRGVAPDLLGQANQALATP